MIAKFDISTIYKHDSGCWSLGDHLKVNHMIISDNCIIKSSK